MKLDIFRWIAALGFMFTVAGNAHAQATVYTATSTGSYTTKTDFTAPCGVGPCQNYTLAMSASGSFTTASPLAGNLVNSNVLASVTAFTFSDGINTYSSTNPAVRVYNFRVSTNASGAITATDILTELWQTGTSPHVIGDRFALVNLTVPVIVYNNARCTTLAVSPAGTTDSCLIETPDTSKSQASGGVVSWTRTVSGTTPQSIPTLSEWGLIIASTLIGLAGFAALRRRSF